MQPVQPIARGLEHAFVARHGGDGLAETLIWDLEGQAHVFLLKGVIVGCRVAILLVSLGYHVMLLVGCDLPLFGDVFRSADHGDVGVRVVAKIIKPPVLAGTGTSRPQRVGIIHVGAVGRAVGGHDKGRMRRVAVNLMGSVLKTTC